MFAALMHRRLEELRHTLARLDRGLGVAGLPQLLLGGAPHHLADGQPVQLVGFACAAIERGITAR